MALSGLSIYDGEARYAGRTRVNRIVYEFLQADLAGQTVVSADIPMNGEAHTIFLDNTSSKLGTNTNTQVVQGKFDIGMADVTQTGATTVLPYITQIRNIDYTTAAPAPYVFQTSEGGATGEIILASSVGVNGHSGSPTAPNVGGGAAMATVVPWTGRVCGTVRFTLTTTSAWAADTGTIRLVVVYS
jgi:hypothetical protein